VHVLFAEPTGAPCVLLGLASGLHEKIAVTDVGLSGASAADGLAVARPSALACDAMDHLVAGVYTVKVCVCVCVC
jgi:D-serine dehydratase